MAEKDWKVVRTDEHPVLDEKDMEICRLREIILHMADGIATERETGFWSDDQRRAWINGLENTGRKALEPSND